MQCLAVCYSENQSQNPPLQLIFVENPVSRPLRCRLKIFDVHGKRENKRENASDRESMGGKREKGGKGKREKDKGREKERKEERKRERERVSERERKRKRERETHTNTQKEGEKG